MSSGHDIADDLHTILKHFSIQALAKVLMLSNKRNTPLLENISRRNWGVLAPLVDKQTSFINIGGVDVMDTETAGYGNPMPYTRKINADLNVFTLQPTFTGSPTFPYSNLKNAGKGILDGTMYASVVEPAGCTDIDFGTAAFGIAIWVKPTDNGTYYIFCRRDTSGSGAGIELYITGGTIVLKISDGATVQTLTSSVVNYTDGNWHSIIANIPTSGNNLEVFFDNVSKGTLSRTAGSLTNSRTSYVFANDNGGTIQNKFKGAVSWFVLKRSLWSSTNRTDYQTNDFIDHSVAVNDEILTYPMMYDTNPYPVVTCGEFRCT